MVFFDKRFKYQLDVCNLCHDLVMMSININSVAILNIQGVHYRCIINKIRKNDVLNLLQKAELNEEKGVLKKFKNFLPYIKWVKKL